MGDVRMPSAIEPSQWFVVFHETTKSRLVSLFAFGRFKHVTAFGYCAGFKAWLHVDPQFGRLRLSLLSQEQAVALSRDAVLVKVAPACGINFLGRIGLYCVPTIRYLLGLPCVALTPTGLYRQILRNGGILIDGGYSEPSAVAGRPIPAN